MVNVGGLTRNPRKESESHRTAASWLISCAETSEVLNLKTTADSFLSNLRNCG